MEEASVCFWSVIFLSCFSASFSKFSSRTDRGCAPKFGFSRAYSRKECSPMPKLPSFAIVWISLLLLQSYTTTTTYFQTTKHLSLVDWKTIFYSEKVCDGTKMTLSEGIVKINSRVLDSSELKRYDKLEKEGISHVGSTQKGKDIDRWIFKIFFRFMIFWIIKYSLLGDLGYAVIQCFIKQGGFFKRLL